MSMSISWDRERRSCRVKRCSGQRRYRKAIRGSGGAPKYVKPPFIFQRYYDFISVLKEKSSRSSLSPARVMRWSKLIVPCKKIKNKFVG